MSTDLVRALPVRLAVDRRLADDLVPHLEGALGWQVTTDDELPAALALVGVGAPPPGVGVPTVLLVRADDPPGRAARQAREVTEVLRWPDDREHLPAVAAHLLDPSMTRATGATTVRIGGSSGGVGTTTVTLALAGLMAWAGRSVLVVASGDVAVPDVPAVAGAALASHRTWQAAAGVPGVDGLRVVTAGAGGRAAVAAPEGTIVLHDSGVGEDVDILVCRRDRAGLKAATTTVAGATVVVDAGPIPAAAWARASGGAGRQLTVPWSARVARAGVHQRVPGSLPGRWLASLRPLAASLVR